MLPDDDAFEETESRYLTRIRLDGPKMYACVVLSPVLKCGSQALGPLIRGL